MTSFRYCLAGLAALLMLTPAFADEAGERKAFIGFLQSILAQPGAHFPVPTAEQEKSFGEYAPQYTLLTKFNDDLGSIFGELIARMKRVGLQDGVHKSMEQLVNHRDDITAVRADIEATLKKLDARIAELNAERATFKQPGDLKVVYGKTFDRLIAEPARAMEHSYNALNDGLAVSLRLADYINGHKDKVTVWTSQVIAKDQKTQDEIKALNDEQIEAAKRFRAAQSAAQKAI